MSEYQDKHYAEAFKTLISFITENKIESTECDKEIESGFTLHTLDCDMVEDQEENGEENSDKTWFDEIAATVMESTSSFDDSFGAFESSFVTDKNFYYTPKLVKDLKRLLNLLPLWSNVMLEKVQLSEVATSSALESFFNTVKNNLFKNFKSNSLRIDVFLEKYEEYLRASCLKFSDEGKILILFTSNEG